MQIVIKDNPLQTEGTLVAARDISSFAISFFVTGCILVSFMLSTADLLHWFVIPVYLCGLMMGADAVYWFRGRLGLFHPVGILGLLGYHFFFLAPLLHLHWDYWLRYISPLPNDWRPWLGAMAILNFVGLLLYRFVRGLRLDRYKAERTTTTWQLNESRFQTLLIIGLLTTGSLQLLVYASFDGIGGYINAYSDRSGAFAGMGFIFMIAESFPIFAMMGYSVYAKGSKRTRGWFEICAVLLAFLVLKLLFGGLRGSRSNTIWGLFWAAGIVHVWVRPLSKKILFVGLAFVVFFMYLYGFYKALGSDVFEIYDQSNGSVAALEAKSGRSTEGLLLNDLGRTDIQALTLERIVSPDNDYQYAKGQTYVGAISLLIPEAIWPGRPETKSEAGTDALYGEGTFETTSTRSSRVFGLAGEALLNFGPFLVPFVFVPFGLFVGWIKRLYEELDPSDTRWLLMPLLINFAFVVLSSDSDNAFFFLIKNGAVPVMIVILSSIKLTQRAGAV